MEILPLTRSNIQRVTGDRPQSSNDYRQLSETTRSTDLSEEGDQRPLTRANLAFHDFIYGTWLSQMKLSKSASMSEPLLLLLLGNGAAVRVAQSLVIYLNTILLHLRGFEHCS